MCVWGRGGFTIGRILHSLMLYIAIRLRILKENKTKPPSSLKRTFMGFPCVCAVPMGGIDVTDSQQKLSRHPLNASRDMAGKTTKPMYC